MTCEPDAVFRMLVDGWLYANWVVGAHAPAVSHGVAAPDGRSGKRL